MEKTHHIAILPSPGMGHLIPMAEFAKQLVKHHPISVTIIIPTTGTPPKAQLSVLESLPENIHHLFLPSVNIEAIPKGTRPEILISFIMQSSLISLRDALISLKSRTNLVALVYDMFGHDSMEVAKELCLFNFLFFPMSAMALSFTFILPKLDEETSCEYKDLPDPVKVPGSVSFHGRELMAPVQIRTDEAYKGYLLLSKRLTLLDGILVNSFEELEDETFRVLRTSQTPIYPIGPLIQSAPSSGSDRHDCIKWLDNQPDKSVVLVCFGSGGTLSLDQIHELALGLELSGHKFLWIVRSPDEKSSNASFFTASSQTNPLGFLPEGFLARTLKRGFVVSSWAPQIEILSHKATGGFLTHCGWNSTLESVVHGVPMIAWPLYAEQHMNAKVMTEALCLALRAETDENGMVRKDVIEKVVKKLMEGDDGKKISTRLNELKVAAIKALVNGGSSMESLCKFAQQLT